MARISTLDFGDLNAEQEGVFDTLRATYGTLPESFLTLGRSPDILNAAAKLAIVVMREGRVSADMKWLMAHIASRASGCSYCSAHTGYHAAVTEQATAEKIEAVWEFETSDKFTDAERAALRIARDAAMVPNAVTDEQFVELRRHFDDDQIVELIAPVALFGFFNRWNDTFSTDLESTPKWFAAEHLSESGWQPKQASNVEESNSEAEKPA